MPCSPSSRASERHDAALAGDVVEHPGDAAKGGARADIDDLAVTLGDHVRSDVLDHQKRPAQIDRHHLVPQLGVDLGALRLLQRREQPALLTSTSILPKRSMAAATNALTADSSLTSTTALATEFAPCSAAISCANSLPSAMSAKSARRRANGNHTESPRIFWPLRPLISQAKFCSPPLQRGN